MNARIFILCVWGLLSPCAVHAEGVEERIAEIRKRYAEITGDTSLVKKSLSGECDGVTAEMSRFMDKSRLVAVELEFGADHGAQGEHYYYDEAGALFFYFQEGSSWNFDGEDASGNSRTIDRSTETRVYFDGGTIIRKLERKYEGRTPEEIDRVKKIAKNEPLNVEEDEAERLVSRAEKLREVSTAKALTELVCGVE